MIETYLLLASNFFKPWRVISRELLESNDGLELPSAALRGEKGGFGEFCWDLFREEVEVFSSSDAWVSRIDSRMYWKLHKIIQFRMQWKFNQKKGTFSFTKLHLH